ncbi:ABC transporter permease/substrate-binding protein [Paenibacillus sp. J31TS4]|uniref:ABC transporter permease/substrate-binding protein n=1 Tax=Paenibacillus sp. J31TS4 TaxID=2807195 RepID=UPI001B1DE35C|nr:ABC transporter permease/substrate-binding protein [Paenibacillus sp. J31TS4]GIP39827.1 ABC transporter permease/substrate-binding protein [Paenibacillus sp. J31TS4]
MNVLLDVLQERQSQLAGAIAAHLVLSFLALVFAVLLALPLGIWLSRRPRAAEAVIGVASVLQTIPSLALLGMMIPLLGIGKLPAVIALVLYALLPILRNTYTGIREVDPALIEAAEAMGMNSRKRLFKVELPLAASVILAGIRTATVLIISTATLAALIGAGGLGDLILLGIDRNDTALLLLGAIPAALLALLFDLLLRGLGRLGVRRLVPGAAAAVLLVAVIAAAPLLGGSKDNRLVVAGKLGAEPEILIQMYRLLIEENTDLRVELKPGLGKTSFLFKALQSGDIDLYPEFTGTAISEFLKEPPISTDRKQVYEQARAGMAERFGMELLAPMAYNNTYALAMPAAFAEAQGLRTISDLKKVQSTIAAGFTLEFADREDGYRGIQKRYGIELARIAKMEPKIRYQAIQSGDIQLVDAYSTDSELQQYGLKMLEDDRGLFPPYQGAPLLRKETLERHPELRDVLGRLAGLITDEEMRGMNYKVNVEGASAEETARTYLWEAGLLP